MKSYIRFAMTLLFGHLFVGYGFAQVPSAPASFYVISLDGKNELHWNANAGAELVTDYKIYRSEDRVIFSPITTIAAAPTPTYMDNSLDNGKEYFYKVSAINISGEGPASAIDAGVPQKDMGRFMYFNRADTISSRNCNSTQLNGISFTIEFWLRIRELPFLGNEAYIMSRYRINPATGAHIMSYAIGLTDQGKLELRMSNVNTKVSTTSGLTTNQWFHVAIAFVRTGSPATNTAKIYINGNLVPVTRTASVPEAIPSVGGKLIFGASYNGVPPNQFLYGYLDEVRMWNYERSQPQVASNICVRTRGDEPGLMGLWHFDEFNKIIGPKIYDYSINGGNIGGNDPVGMSNTTVFTPIANNDYKTITYNTASIINIQKNDVNFSDTKKITTSLLPGYPVYGATSILNNDSLNYIPKSGFSGADTIKYILADTASYCGSPPKYDTATVIIYVPCNQKDNLSWAKRAVGQSAKSSTFIEKGLFANFSTYDINNIVDKIEIAKDFQYLNSVVWQQDPSNIAQQSKVTLAFNMPIDQFCFKLIDIDNKSGGYTDSVIVNAYHNGQPINLSNGDFDLGPSVSFTGNNSFKGIAQVDDAAAATGNASICYYTLVDSIQITFTNASDAPNNPQAQNIGIGDFSWCALTNHAPQIVDMNYVGVDTVDFTVFENQLLKACLYLQDEDKDSLYITSAISPSITGKVNIVSFRCLEYTPKKDYIGTELFEVMACDNRMPALCDKVIIRMKVIPLCGTQSQLNWDKFQGQNPRNKAFNKEGLVTRISSRAHAQVASSMKIGKKFHNKPSIEWNQNGAKKKENSDVIMAFNHPVNQFSFDLYDLDKENVNSTDSLIVKAYNNGDPVDLSSSNIKVIGSAVSFVGNNAFKGILDADDANSEDGNISIVYFAPIDSIVLRFANASLSNPGNVKQECGIGNLYWCTIPNVAPVVLDYQKNPIDSISLSTTINTPLKICLRMEDVNLDSVEVAEIIPIDGRGEMLAPSIPDTCLTYTPSQNFLGEESFRVKVCDNRMPPLCTQVEIKIKVLPSSDASLFISEGLSPNGDNILDYWVIQGIENYPKSRVQVFNVWGDLIFEQSNYQNEIQAWKGEANRGTALGSGRAPDGTYYYVVNLGDGSALRKGYVMLKR